MGIINTRGSGYNYSYDNDTASFHEENGLSNGFNKNYSFKKIPLTSFDFQFHIYNFN